MLAEQVADVVGVNVAKDSLQAVTEKAGMTEGFDIGLEMSGQSQAFDQMVSSLVMGGKIAMLGIPMARQKLTGRTLYSKPS